MARQVLDNGVILPSEYSDDWYDDMTSNLTKLDEVIGSDAEKLDESDVGAAAISNDYDDLDDKPTYNILRRASVTLTAGGTGNYSDLDSDSKIKAGDYVLDAANKLYSITAIDAANSTYTVSAAAIINITDKSELGAAALSNSYDDLNNLPGYGILRFCSTAITDNSSVPFSNISSVSKIAAGDFLLDTAGKMYVIASVDTVNETAAVTTPISQLALDANVMHLSGNETASGQKTFNSNTSIYNSDNSAVTPNLYLRSSKIEIAAQGNTSGDQNLVYADKNNTVYAYVKGTIQSNGSAVKIRASCKDNSDNSIINEIQILANTNGRKIIFPSNTNETELGTSSYKWKDVNTYLVNGLTPSSLSLPDLNNAVDISGYITDLTGSPNVYSPPANGYIVLRSTTANLLGIVENTTGMGSYSRGSNQVLAVNLPVVKNSSVSIYAICTSLTHAKFIPCQGNI